MPIKILIVFLSLFYPLSYASAQADPHIRTAPALDALKRDIHEVRPMRKDYYVFRTNRHLTYFRTDENIYLTIAFWADTQKRYLAKEIPSEV